MAATKRTILAAMIGWIGLCAAERVAYLPQGSTSIVVVEDGTNHQIKSDGRPKSLLRWLYGGKGLSYFVEDDVKGGLGKLVVIDTGGTIVKEIPTRRPGPSLIIGMRFIEEAEWLSDHVIRLSGSFNPRNCEWFDVDIDTGLEIQSHGGACNSLRTSPDGVHFAYLDLRTNGTSSEVADVILMDKGIQVYPKPGQTSDFSVLIGPVWSSDSRHLAALIKRIPAGSTFLLTLSTGDQAPSVVEVGEYEKEDTIVSDFLWLGELVAIESRGTFLIADPHSGGLVSPTKADERRIAQLRYMQTWDASSALGGLKAREAVLWISTEQPGTRVK